MVRRTRTTTIQLQYKVMKGGFILSTAKICAVFSLFLSIQNISAVPVQNFRTYSSSVVLLDLFIQNELLLNPLNSQSDYLTPLTSEEDFFKTTWRTTSSNESITIPTTGSGYNYTIDWGDGTIESNQMGDATHTYASAGDHVIKISGDFPRIYINNTGDKEKIISIDQWGNIQWQSMQNAFYGARNLEYTAIDVPDLTSVNTLEGTFRGANSFDGDIGNWNTENISDM